MNNKNDIQVHVYALYCVYNFGYIYSLSLLTLSAYPFTHQPPAPAASTRSSGPRYVAIYDYTAADDDEVSFNEGIEVLVD